jgi:uridine kinase
MLLMPTGLDGNRDPVSTAERDRLLAHVAAAIARLRRRDVLFVGVDGAAGAGKSTLADELAGVLASEQVPVIRSSTDSFHNPRAVRWRAGRDSPEGYYLDSHDLRTLQDVLLDPLANGLGEFRRAAFDEPTDSPVQSPLERASPGSVLLFDGLFLHRPELRHYWNYSIFVDADQRIRARRLAIALDGCDASSAAAVAQLVERAIDGKTQAGNRSAPRFDEWWGLARRYVEGWRLYTNECNPAATASTVIDNNDLTSPRILTEWSASV